MLCDDKQKRATHGTVFTTMETHCYQHATKRTAINTVTIKTYGIEKKMIGQTLATHERYLSILLDWDIQLDGFGGKRKRESEMNDRKNVIFRELVANIDTDVSTNGDSFLNAIAHLKHTHTT